MSHKGAVGLRRARLVLGWVTVFGWQSSHLSHHSQPTSPRGTGNERRCSEYSDAVWTRSNLAAVADWINVFGAVGAVPSKTA